MNFNTYNPEHFRFNGEQLTPEAVEKARQSFAENAQACIDEVKTGQVRVNDPEKYFRDCQDRREKYLTGNFNVSLTFLQHAYYLQTGKSIALLP